MRTLTGCSALLACLLLAAGVHAPGGPAVIHSSLPDGSRGMSPSRVGIVLTFSAPMDWDSVYSAFRVEPDAAYTLTHGNVNLSITLTALTPGTRYTIMVASTASDRSGTQMGTPYTLTFTTSGPPPSGEDAAITGGTVVLLLFLLAVASVAVASFIVLRRDAPSGRERAATAPRCRICRGTIRRAQERVECIRCGAKFHETCAERESGCPLCRGRGRP